VQQQQQVMGTPCRRKHYSSSSSSSSSTAQCRRRALFQWQVHFLGQVLLAHQLGVWGHQGLSWGP
jgi:hypothetical protein